MADQIKLTAALREDTGKGAAKRLRRAGKVPAVLYGRDRDTRSLTVESSELFHALHTSAGMNVLVNLKAGEVEQLAMPKSVQRHPVRGDYLHIDFVRIDTETDVHVEIPLHTRNDESVRPGVVSVTLQQVPIICKPLNVPDSIWYDLEGLGIGDSVHAGQLELPEGVVLDVDDDRTVITITAPTEVEVEEEEAVEDLAALEGLSEEELAKLAEVAEAGGEEAAEGSDQGGGGE